MKKGIFLVFHGFAAYNGISKKISYQIEGLRKCGADIKLCYYDVTSEGERVWKLDEKIIFSYGKGTIAKIKRRIDYSGITREIISSGVDFIYIRSMHNANPFTIRMFKKLERAGIKIYMEIPTYPYDKEYFLFRMKIDLFFDKCFRKALAKHIYRIVTFSDYDTIFGCPTIKISNGIDFDAITLKTKINDTSKQLNLIGVAEIHHWHGFDRLIKGLADYYRNEPSYKVTFHLVGAFFSRIEEEEITTPIRQFHLEPYVKLYGNKQGKELDELFEIADLGIGSLARHRSNITHIKTLKNREYAARGIPFIYSETDSDFETKPYILKVPADETSIDIPNIIAFYHRISNISPMEIRNSISDLSWEKQMKKVLE